MDNRVVHVPISWLLDPELTASTKVVWMALLLCPGASPGDLEMHTGLSRHTVLSGLGLVSGSTRAPGGAGILGPAAPLADRAAGARAKLPAAPLADRAAGAQAKIPASPLADRAAGAQAKMPASPLADRAAGAQAKMPAAPLADRAAGAQAKIPAALLADRAAEAQAKMPAALLAERFVGAQAKVVYGLLQAIPGFREGGGQFTYTSLSALTQVGRNTLKRAITELVGAGWVEVAQVNRLRTIQFTLGTPESKRSQAAAAEARRRLKRARFGGEALMHEYLSLLIDSDQFTDNARPGFLVHPQTGERLELDRFYPPNVAFEFNGAQHYGATGRVSQAEADAQHLRDLIKAGICLYRGIHLVIIHAADLSLQGMTKKVGQSMPLRSLAGQEALIDLLEEVSLIYRSAARKAGSRTRSPGPESSSGMAPSHG